MYKITCTATVYTIAGPIRVVGRYESDDVELVLDLAEKLKRLHEPCEVLVDVGLSSVEDMAMLTKASKWRPPSQN